VSLKEQVDGMHSDQSDIARVTRSKAEAERGYDRLSRWYDLLAEGSERRARDAALRMLGAREGETVLEIGFGTGHGIVALAQGVGTSGRVYGIDLSPGMLRVAEARVRKAGLSERVQLQLGDATRLPFREGFFNAVFLSFVLELFDTPEIPVVLAECRRVLRMGGRIGVVALSKQGRPGMAARLYEWAHRRFPALVDCRPIHVRRAVQQAGFQPMEVAETSMWWLPVEIVVARKG